MNEYYEWDEWMKQRWISIHCMKYFEKYADRSITEDRIFEYIDSAKSNVLAVILTKSRIEKFAEEFREALETNK